MFQSPRNAKALLGEQREMLQIQAKVIDNIGVKRADMILDIGCGTGQGTKLLGEKISFRRIIGVDSDPTMIYYARKSNNNYSEVNNNNNNNGSTNSSSDSQKSQSKIMFLAQDISKPWDELHKGLRLLEGHVDLIYSFDTLHWIPTRGGQYQALKNLKRLLRPGGRYMAVVGCVQNFNDLVSPEERKENERFISIPSPIEQYDLWETYFRVAGLSPNVEFKEGSFRLPEGRGVYENRNSYLVPYLVKGFSSEAQKGILKSLEFYRLQAMAYPPGMLWRDKFEVSNADRIYFQKFEISGKKTTS